jgi:hypothetical protein
MGIVAELIQGASESFTLRDPETHEPLNTGL